MSKFFTTAFAAFATVGLLAAAATPARAQDARTDTRMVQTADLDLHTAAGAATLQHRVRLAASKVCGEPELLGSPEGASYAACVTHAEQDAVRASDAMIAAVRTENRFASATPSN